MAASSSSSATIMPESVCEEGLELFEANSNILLMALMEETQEDVYCQEDDRLVDMIQSLEAEICSSSSCSPALHDIDEVERVDDQDCSTLSISWEDIEVASASFSSSSYDEDMMDAWSLCAAGGDDNTSEFYYGILLGITCQHHKNQVM